MTILFCLKTLHMQMVTLRHSQYLNVMLYSTGKNNIFKFNFCQIEKEKLVNISLLTQVAKQFEWGFLMQLILFACILSYD